MSYLNADQEESLITGISAKQLENLVAAWASAVGDYAAAVERKDDFARLNELLSVRQRLLDEVEYAFRMLSKELSSLRSGAKGRGKATQVAAVKAPTPCEKEDHNYQLAHFDFPCARVFCSRCGKTASLKW